jgi:hypothetical protein
MAAKFKYVYLNYQGQNVLGRKATPPKEFGGGYVEYHPTLDELTENGWKHSSTVVVGNYVLVILEMT